MNSDDNSSSSSSSALAALAQCASELCSVRGQKPSTTSSQSRGVAWAPLTSASLSEQGAAAAAASERPGGTSSKVSSVSSDDDDDDDRRTEHSSLSAGNSKSTQHATRPTTASTKKSKAAPHGNHTAAKKKSAKAKAGGTSCVSPRLAGRKGNNKKTKSSKGSAASGEDDGLSQAISSLFKPKHQLTAYNFFFQSERRRIMDMGLEAYEAQMAGRAAQPDATSTSTETSPPNPKRRKIPFEVMGKTIGRAWSNISLEELSKYQKLAAEDKKRYERERTIYDAEVAFVRATWDEQKSKNTSSQTGTGSSKGSTKASSSGTSRLTSSSEKMSSTTWGSLGSDSSLISANAEEEATIGIINSLSKEQIHALLALHHKNGATSSSSAPAQLVGNPPVPTTITTTGLAYAPSANGSITTTTAAPDNSRSTVSPPQNDAQLASILLVQSAQISHLQSQVNQLLQQQRQGQPQLLRAPPPPTRNPTFQPFISAAASQVVPARAQVLPFQQSCPPVQPSQVLNAQLQALLKSLTGSTGNIR